MAEVLALLARARVKLNVEGDDILCAQRTAKDDGSLGVRLTPLEAKTKEHFQAIFNPSHGRFQLLHANEDRPEHTAERHTPLMDVRIAQLVGLEQVSKPWVLAILRPLLARVRLASPEVLAEERFLVANRDAMSVFIASLPQIKRKGRPVVSIDAGAIMAFFKVVSGSELRSLGASVAGRIVRRRGRLAISHVAFPHPTLDLVTFMNLAAFVDVLPNVRSLAVEIAGAGGVPTGSVDEVPSPGEIHGAPNWRMPILSRALESPDEPSRPHLDALFGMSGRELVSRDRSLHYAVARGLCEWLDERGELWPFYHTWRDGFQRDPDGRLAFQSVEQRTPAEASRAWAQWMLEKSRGHAR